jgi:hypothetical protein
MEENIRNISFAVIIAICVVAIIVAICVPIANSQKTEENTITNTVTVSEENKELAENFNKLFNNKLDYQDSNINTIGITKTDSSKDIIYTAVSTKRVVENRYDIDLNIPVINISNNTSVEHFNEKIQSLFVDKANDIMLNATLNTIYSIDYTAYVNTNILSLVIRSTLKEGNNAQRVIVQTYNYNLSTNEEITLKQILDIKDLNQQNVEAIIAMQVKTAYDEAESLKKLGYNVYSRDLTSDIYTIENTDNYIIGPDNKLYIIYPYGNSYYTDEMDVIVF